MACRKTFGIMIHITLFFFPGDLVSQCPFENVSVDSLVWLADNTLVTGSSDSLIRVWNILPGQSSCRLTLSGHQRPVQALALSPQFLASASGENHPNLL